ncbi:hypothetical protein [Streptomyces sp. NPDC002952]|uniref:hypothetical protein n=1 Tax=Streptomyces sp. NPDC002952 TaxID=3364673 RepID=UPI0036D02DBD
MLKPGLLITAIAGLLTTAVLGVDGCHGVFHVVVLPSVFILGPVLEVVPYGM